ncbi:MAG: DnaJ domain-containing protein [Apibacter sp.]|uniref:J domain-containing protein n=1 Tax=Apibacter sp. TaxID=2023709 RepID=UPI0025EAE6BB|nr:DnaJ domain-containing protein [Apibacter sp.]MCT6868853.1 DnaJ domain-containing protein [Apibacter sp.]
MKDFYKILEIDSSASLNEIKKSYRRLALQFHPDRNFDNKLNEKKIIDIIEAYKTLSNEKLRKKYDLIYRNKIISTQPITPYVFLKKIQDIRKFIYDKGANKVSKNALYNCLEKLLSDKNIKFLHLNGTHNILKQIIVEVSRYINFLQDIDKDKIIIKLYKLTGGNDEMIILVKETIKQNENKYNFINSIISKLTYKLKKMFNYLYKFRIPI